MEASIHLTHATDKRPPNAVTRLFSSVWFGIVLLTLILTYACVASALPQVRGIVEMTEMQIFAHWTFAVLVGLFVVTMSVTTWRRIRWNLTNLGVLTVHTGLILLTLGSAWYFGTKIEGDVQLFSPKIELISTQNGQMKVVGHLLAAKDSTWRGFVDAVQSPVELRVLSTHEQGAEPVVEVTLQAQMPDGVKSVSLSSGKPWQALNDQLGVVFQPATRADHFYDAETAALFVRKEARGRAELVASLPALPRHRERFLPGGPEIRDTSGGVVASKRVTPEIPYVHIPTGWFEPWRMPIAVHSDRLPFDITITGYLPYCERLAPAIQRDTEATEDRPALRFVIDDEDQRHVDQSLLALDPRRNLSDTQMPFEFVWVSDAAEVDSRLMPMSGPNELTVELKMPPFRQTFTVQAGQTIQVPGSDYVLTIQSVIPSWPMITPPFENALSPVARVQVRNGQREFNRTVIQRFPQLSQDIDAEGKRHKEPLDDNLTLRFRTVASGWGYFVSGPSLPLTFAMYSPDGSMTRGEVALNHPIDVKVLDGTVRMTVTAYEQRAREQLVPVVTPLEHRRPGLRRAPATVRLEMRGRGEYSGWTQTGWLFHSDYPEITPNELPVTYPGDKQTYRLILSREPHDLRATLANDKLTVQFQPGGTQVDRWRSDFRYQARDGTVGRAMVETNRTDTVQGWTYFQSGAPRQDEWEWTILGVGNRRGIWPMLLGSCLIPLGSWYAFYVKPWLIRRRQQAALAGAKLRGANRIEPESARLTERDKAGVA